MMIHHYTSAAVLSEILRSGKIRFRRADLLDDGSEMPFLTSHLNPANYFISSWSALPHEHSGLWYRYADQHRGIRITLPVMPFPFRHVTWHWPDRASSEFGIKLNDAVIPFTTDDMLGEGYLLMPYNDMPVDFAGEVEYVAEPALRVAEILTFSASQTITKRPGALGRIKTLEWADQQEYRFVIMAFEAPLLSRRLNSVAYDCALLELMERRMGAGGAGTGMIAPEVEFIDLPVCPNALSSMTVTLGSSISVCDRQQILQAVRGTDINVAESNMVLREPFSD
ncbi:hypothetical protein [Pantoea agglomerans]|uniref:hypothetical protein n=1 Tax=Enterobacter agglomerans TaxID=549 RepID=UPI003C7D7D22